MPDSVRLAAAWSSLVRLCAKQETHSIRKSCHSVEYKNRKRAEPLSSAALWMPFGSLICSSCHKFTCQPALLFSLPLDVFETSLLQPQCVKRGEKSIVTEKERSDCPVTETLLATTCCRQQLGAGFLGVVLLVARDRRRRRACSAVA